MTFKEHRRLFGSKILDHFQHPRNLGLAANFNRRYLERDNPWLVRILITVRVGNSVIEEIKFKAKSCVTTVACVSALTELVQNKRVEEALSITPQQLSEYLGIVPAEKMYCCHLAVDTLRRAISCCTQDSNSQHFQEEGETL
jgi:NifU-like protein